MQIFQASLKLGLKLHYNLTIPENEAYNADFSETRGNSSVGRAQPCQG
jgi:hypothetical protein